jgi:large conductance mechanosensitive channel
VEERVVHPLTERAKVPARAVVTLADEFRQFAFKGNLIDLAVAVIVGGAFGKLVDSLVKSVLMPLIAVLLPGQEGYRGWKWVIDGHEVPFGVFLGEAVNFLIVTLVVFFVVVKFLGWLNRFRQKQAEVPPLTKEQELLTEIRDLLRQRQEPPRTEV